MESNDLLHPETDENQNVEVNAGASTEAQMNAEQDETTATEKTAEPTASEAVSEPVVAEEEKQEVKETAEMPAAVEEPQAENAAEIIAEIEQANEPADVQEPVDTKNEAEPEESLEQIEKEYANLSLSDAVAELQRIVVEPNYNKVKQRVGVLKVNILALIKELKKEAFEKYKQEGGNPDEYEAAPIAEEKSFGKAMDTFKANKQKFLDQIEAEKQRNLEAKQAIIEGLKKLVETKETATLKELNDKFKEYQDQWKNVGPVPQNESNDLWQNYHFYVEQFFDILRINKELRFLDMKKNLEQKIKLCEKAEELLLEESVNKSFQTLQQLHEEWKEIGPVEEAKKEEIWERFKNASDQINQRRREHYDKMYAEMQSNYNAKVVLCEKAEEIIAQEAGTIKENNTISDQLTELLKVWKTIGPAPGKLNDEIWERFKGSLDKFFSAKKEYFQQIKDTQTQNYNLKLNLAIRAEAVANRTDWRSATGDILALQKEWKEIGAVPRKNAEAIWKRFRAACDKFFAAKADYFANAKNIEAENLRKKEELVKKILEHIFTGNKSEDLNTMKAYQREWTEIGFVPKNEKDRIYNEYREAVNKRFADLKVTAEEMRHDTFKNRIDTILNDPNADRLLDKEKRFLTNKLAQLKDDINLWENNLGFFANSKNADLLKEEFSKKIEAAKVEVKELEYKIKMMNKEKSNGEK
ncbi:MAG: DUF349 domain-containing protein [Bacteroidales bacterium]|nr:DUF349 domain-containing protein [Bacteroidales bacterium]